MHKCKTDALNWLVLLIGARVTVAKLVNSVILIQYLYLVWTPKKIISCLDSQENYFLRRN